VEKADSSKIETRVNLKTETESKFLTKGPKIDLWKHGSKKRTIGETHKMGYVKCAEKEKIEPGPVRAKVSTRDNEKEVFERKARTGEGR